MTSEGGGIQCRFAPSLLPFGTFRPRPRRSPKLLTHRTSRIGSGFTVSHFHPLVCRHPKKCYPLNGGRLHDSRRRLRTQRRRSQYGAFTSETLHETSGNRHLVRRNVATTRVHDPRRILSPEMRVLKLFDRLLPSSFKYRDISREPDPLRYLCEVMLFSSPPT